MLRNSFGTARGRQRVDVYFVIGGLLLARYIYFALMHGLPDTKQGKKGSEEQGECSVITDGDLHMNLPRHRWQKHAK